MKDSKNQTVSKMKKFKNSKKRYTCFCEETGPPAPLPCPLLAECPPNLGGLLAGRAIGTGNPDDSQYCGIPDGNTWVHCERGARPR